MADSFRKYLVEFWQMKGWEQMNAWLCDHPEYAALEAWGIETNESTLGVKRQKAGGTIFITCSKFFEKSPKLPELFSIVRGYIAHNAMPRIEVLLDERHREGLQTALDENVPFRWPQHDLFLFGNVLWRLTDDDTTASTDELRLLFLEAVDGERRKFGRLKSKFSEVAVVPRKLRRESIPETVKIFVWRRDEGKCVNCGSHEKLEFDHIIPVEKGGSSTERNIQLLCEPCNRKKSNQIQ